MIKLLQLLLIKLYVIKHDGLHYSGSYYLTKGVVYWNPLTYIVIILVSLFVGIFGFFDGIYGTMSFLLKKHE